MLKLRLPSHPHPRHGRPQRGWTAGHKGHNRDILSYLISSRLLPYTDSFHHVVGFKYILPQSNFNIPSTQPWDPSGFPAIPTLFGRPVPLMPIYSLVPPQKSSTEFSDEFGRIFCRNSFRGAVNVSIKKHRNVEKGPHPRSKRCQGQGTRCCPRRRRNWHPDVRFFPSQPRLTRWRACKPVRFRPGPYLHLSSLVIFVPHHYHHPLSRSAQCDLAHFWRSSMLCLGRCPRVSLVCPHQDSCFAPNFKPWIPLLMIEHHRSPPAGAGIRIPFLSTLHRHRLR